MEKTAGSKNQFDFEHLMYPQNSKQLSFLTNPANDSNYSIAAWNLRALSFTTPAPTRKKNSIFQPTRSGRHVWNGKSTNKNATAATIPGAQWICNCETRHFFRPQPCGHGTLHQWVVASGAHWTPEGGFLTYKKNTRMNHLLEYFCFWKKDSAFPIWDHKTCENIWNGFESDFNSWDDVLILEWDLQNTQL